MFDYFVDFVLPYSALDVYVYQSAQSCEHISEASISKALLHDPFLLKDIGNAKYFHGLKLSTSSKCTYLSQ